MYLVSHDHSAQCDVSSQTLHLRSHVHKIQGDPLPHPGPGSHVYSLKCDSTSQKLHVGSHINSFQSNPFLILYLGSNSCGIQGDSLPDHYTWDHMSTVSSMS